MRDDARAGLQFVHELRLELQVQRRQEVERYDAGRRQIRLEEVAFDDLHAILDAGLLDVLTRLRDALRIDVDPDTARAIRLRRGDRNTTVTGAEVIDDVVLGDLRQLEHRIDDLLRRWYEDHVGGAKRLLG